MLYSADNLELSLDDNSRGGWVVFFCAVKRIINTSPASHKLLQQEYSVFLDWFFYHEVLAEFAVRHWVVPYQGCGYAPIARSRIIEGDRLTVSGIVHAHQQCLTQRQMENTIGCPTDVLRLVAHVCGQAIVAKSSETNHVNLERERAKELEQIMSRTVGGYYSTTHLPSPTLTDRKTMVSDVHRIACLIYVNRAIHHVSGLEFRHRRLVRQGLLLLTKLKTCQCAWPLFIVACEATHDDQRLAILDVFEHSRQDRRRRSSHVHLIQHMVQAVWNQHDLDTENQVDYLTILDAVVGGVPFMPAFA